MSDQAASRVARTYESARTRSVTAAALLVLGAALILAGCGPATYAASPAVAGPPRHGGTVSIGIVGEPPVLNRYLADAGVASLWLPNKAMFQPWVDIAPGMQPVPVLATSVPTPANGEVTMRGQQMIVRFGVQPRAHWSDGIPITCADMRFTWQTLTSPKWAIGSRSGWRDIVAVQCPTPKQVVLVFRHSEAGYLDEVLFPGPLPEHALAGKDFDAVWNSSISVTDGPFVFDRWQHGRELDLKRSPDYWNAGKEQRPYLDHLRFVFENDPNTAAIQASTGELDVLNTPLGAPLADERATYPEDAFSHAPATQLEQLGLQTSRGPLRDVRVRQAIAYALDRTQLAHALFGDQQAVLQSTLIPAQSPYYRPAFARYSHDPAKVAQLLTAAGYARAGSGTWSKDGHPLMLGLASPDDLARPLTQLVQQQLQSVGIATRISIQTSSVFYGQTTPSGDWDLAIWPLNVYWDAGQGYYFECSRYDSGVNYWHWCSPSVMREVRASDDLTQAPASRVAAFAALQDTMAAQVPLIPLVQREDTVVSAPRLHGLRENSRGALTWNVANWWVER